MKIVIREAQVILSNPLTILWIAVPLFLQTVFILGLGYGLSRVSRIEL